jgi:hypothetical protein
MTIRSSLQPADVVSPQHVATVSTSNGMRAQTLVAASFRSDGDLVGRIKQDSKLVPTAGADA